MTMLAVALLGVGLAVDASCVCTTNGLVYRPNMLKSAEIALPFAVFQGVMPLIGYFGIGLLPDELFRFNHVIAFILLLFVGAKMFIDGIRTTQFDELCPKGNPREDASPGGKSSLEHAKAKKLTFKVIMIQGVSTSIDALSVGVTLGNESLNFVLISVFIVATITFFMCFGAVRLGERIGIKLNNKAEIIGGIVLVLIGVRLLVAG